jgi:hypothetical protein
LDEGIDILTLLLQSKQADYEGKHYQLKLTAMDPMHYPPPSVQQPRVPLWVVGVWLRMQSRRRVLKYDRLIPVVMNADGQFIDVRPEDIRQMAAYVAAHRTLATPFDIIVEGQTVGMDQAQMHAKLHP